MSDHDLAGCWEVLQSISGIKTTASGACSVVAVSKFLHFWNPRLYIIVDDAFMWRQVFSRAWLKGRVDLERNRVGRLLAESSLPYKGGSCDLLSYLAILSWSARLVQDNPDVTHEFSKYVRMNCGDTPIDFPIDTYDAVAVEWLLLGLAELPPAGVDLPE